MTLAILISYVALCNSYAVYIIHYKIFCHNGTEKVKKSKFIHIIYLILYKQFLLALA